MLKISKMLHKLLFINLIALFCITSVLAYDYEYSFVEEDNAYWVKTDRRAIYDLVDLYYDIVGRSSGSMSYMNYSGVCSTVTVNGYGTYPMDEYVAGVLKGEVSVYSKYPEYLKAQAIAIRSFVIADTKGGCVIDSGAHKQVFKPIDKNSSADQVLLQAANETSGMVILRNGEVALTQYMSYPSPQYSRDENGKWTIDFVKFGDDPSTAWTWVGEKSKDEIQNALGYHAAGVKMGNSHHNGMSQTVGAWLGHQGYSFEEILDTFYGTDETEIGVMQNEEYTANIEYVDSEFGKVWYYNQGDYAQYYYSSNLSEPQYTGSSGNWATIKSHGCGPTALAIVLSSFANQEINPLKITEQVCSMNGCYGSGTSYGTMASLAESYGYKTEFVDKTGDVSKVTDALSKGDSLVIALMGKGTFTSGGHYIVLTGTRSDGSVSVADPGSRERTNTKWFSFDLVVRESKDSGFLIITK